MKIAIASTGKKENSRVSDVAGRAPHYLIFENGKLIKTISNPFKRGGGGAGYGVAEMLSDEAIELVISGKFGENMIRALETKKIAYKELSGLSVLEALEKIE